ncbi:thiopeptide-type bacteriocin biosynthesis protein [Nocardia sp. NPDC003979]
MTENLQKPKGQNRTAHTWVSAHLFYGAELDRIVTDVVAPLITDLGTTPVEDWFFLRYWDGGPHVRLRLRPTAPQYADRIAELIRERAQTFFDREPSRKTWPAKRYREISSYLAAAEGMTDFHTDPYPDNSVQFIDYSPEYDRYGTGVLMAAIEGHFAESSRLGLEVVRSNGLGRRLTVCLAVVLAAWLAATPDVRAITEWTEFRRHRFELADGEHADFEVRFSRQKDGLTAITRRVLAAVHGASTGWQLLEDWIASVDSLRNSICRALVHDPGSVVEVPWQDGSDKPELNFVLPILDACAHLFCNRVGVSLAEEQYVRFLAQRALATCEDERVRT